MGRTDSGRAIDRKDARGEIVYAARRAWEGEPALRRLAIAATLALLVIDTAAFILLGGGAPLLVVLAGLVATTVPFALVVGRRAGAGARGRDRAHPWVGTAPAPSAARVIQAVGSRPVRAR